MMPGSRRDLGLPIVEQFVVPTVVGEGRHKTKNRRDDQKEQSQCERTNRFNNLHVRPNRLRYEHLTVSQGLLLKLPQ